MKQFCCNAAAVAFLAIAGSGAVYAQDIPMDKAVTTGTLPNGFTYYIRKNTTPEKRATLYLVNKVGSVLESDDQRGLAHFLEHMAFNGTKHYPKNELVDYLQKSGVRFGADLNAYTTFDETVYQLPVATEDKTVFKNALQVLRDWAHDVSLDDEEIDKERGVILSEKRQRLGLSQRLQDQTLPLYTNGSLYASRLPIGTDEVLQHFPHEALRRFYQQWYRPDLQALIVVGDVNVAEMEKNIRSLFSDIPAARHATPRPVIDIPLTGKAQFLSVTDAEIPVTKLDLLIKRPALNLRTQQEFKESLMRALFGMIMNDRFNEILLQQDAPFLSAGAGMGPLMANLDAFSSSVSCKPGELEKGITAWWTELERVKRYGITDTELKRACTNFMSSLETLYKEREKTSSDYYVREYVNHFLHGTVSADIAYEYDLSKQLTSQLTAAAFTPFIQQYLEGADKDMVLTANDKLRDSLPNATTINTWMAQAAAASIQPYVDKKVTRTTLMDVLPQTGSIVSEVPQPEVAATLLTLSNGVKVLLKATSFKKDEILFNALSPGGLSLVSDADFYNGSIAAGFLNSSGLADMSARELSTLLTGKRAAVSPFISDYTEGIQGFTTPEDLETALQLIYLHFTAPRKDPIIFNRLIEQLHISYANAGNAPQQLFSDTLTAALNNYHFRKMTMPQAQLDQLNPDRMLEIYKDRFADASDFIFTFTGNFDTAAINPLLARYLGSLPSLHRQEAMQDQHLDLPAGRVSKKLVKGKDPRATVMLVYGNKYDHYTPETNLQLQALAGVLQIALLERLREQEGGVYTVQASPDIRKQPTGQYAFYISFICDPQNVEPLILDVNSEIMKLKTEGPAEDQLTKVKAGESGNAAVVFKQNNFWLQYLSGRLSRNEALTMPDIKEKLKAVTPESLQQTAIQYLTNTSYIRVVLVPESH